MEQQEAERRLQELRDALLDDWLVVTEHLSRTQDEVERSVSWRITLPLRLARMFQLKVREIGVSGAVKLATSSVSRRLGGRP